MRLPDPLVVTPDKQLEQVSPWGVQRNFEAITQRFPLGPDDLHFGGTVTALPTGVDEGFEVNYIADATNGVVWRFKYLPTTSGTYPWLFIGGAPLTAEVSTSQTTTSTSYTDLTTVGPSITLPSIAGDWLIRHGAEMNCSTTNYAFQTIKLGAAAAADAEAVIVGGVASADASAFREIRRNALASGAVLAAKYKTGAGTGQFQKRVLSVLPIRVA